MELSINFLKFLQNNNCICNSTEVSSVFDSPKFYLFFFYFEKKNLHWVLHLFYIGVYVASRAQLTEGQADYPAY